ncbi:MAG: hypothetical protein JSU66_03850 [Deltaproteobacteria bacterium]|nr:MAG: hypothetical protein JSU66_03850 [Deltaproteobacteria bacterium]
MTDQPIFWWGCFVVLIYLAGVLSQTEIPRGEGSRSLLARHGRSKILWFLAAGVSMLLAVYLFFTGDHERGIFVGIWVPSVLAAANLLIARER